MKRNDLNLLLLAKAALALASDWLWFTPAGAVRNVHWQPPAAQKTDHGSGLSRQYSGFLFEQVLFLLTEAIFQSLWDSTDEPAEKLWVRHANLE